jgi:dihydroneopterin aldolase
MSRRLAILIEGIEVFAHHGALPAEREQGQTFRVDVELAPVSDRACDTDDLADAVDYVAVADVVARIVGGEPVDLLEHLADRVARELVAAFPVERVRVTVHKPQAPLGVPFGDVVVTVERDA